MVIKKIVEYFEKQNQIAKQKELERLQEAQNAFSEFMNQRVFKTQLERAIRMMPSHYNFSYSAVFEASQLNPAYMQYQVAKSDIAKTHSVTVCKEMQKMLNKILWQNCFNAWNELQGYYKDSQVAITSLCCEIGRASCRERV